MKCPYHLFVVWVEHMPSPVQISGTVIINWATFRKNVEKKE